MSTEDELPSPQDFSSTRLDLERWRGGDRLAFDAIWLRHRRGVEVFVATEIREVRNDRVRRRLESEMDDLVQDVAATVLSKLADFDYRGQGSLAAWMGTIAANRVWTAVEHWEAQKRNPHAERSLDGDAASPDPAVAVAAPGPGPETSLGIAERRAQIADALALLPARQRRMVILRFYFGAEWQEIAADVGSPSEDAARKEFASRVLPVLGARLRTIGPGAERRA